MPKRKKLYLSEIFDLIPGELNAKNKRFILKKLNKHTGFSRYDNSFMWLKNAGVALPCHNVNEPKLPLLLSRSSNLFKLFLCDVGLPASQYGSGIQLKILNHETAMNFGYVYENIAAQELIAHGFTLCFYNSKRSGELDFVIEHDGNVVPIEIKFGKDYYRRSAMNNVSACKEYDLPKGLVFCNENIEINDNVIYYPIYTLMFLQKNTIPEQLIFDSDFSDINDLLQD